MSPAEILSPPLPPSIVAASAHYWDVSYNVTIVCWKSIFTQRYLGAVHKIRKCLKKVLPNVSTVMTTSTSWVGGKHFNHGITDQNSTFKRILDPTKPAWKAWGCEICLPLVTFGYLSLSLVLPFLALKSLTGPYWALLGFTLLYWTLLGLTGPYWAILSITGSYWALLGLTGPY